MANILLEMREGCWLVQRFRRRVVVSLFCWHSQHTGSLSGYGTKMVVLFLFGGVLWFCVRECVLDYEDTGSLKSRCWVDELSLNLTVNLHYSTQTRRNTLPKAAEHALQTFCNSFCHVFRSFTIV
jgi:hypothetical protein